MQKAYGSGLEDGTFVVTEDEVVVKPYAGEPCFLNPGGSASWQSDVVRFTGKGSSHRHWESCEVRFG